MKIQIITAEDKPVSVKYLLYRLMECWQEAGHTFAVGPVKRLDADLGIVHVDRTVVPADWLPDNPHGRPLLNVGILDISKSRISRQRVQQGDGYAGPVILKSNYNAFGGREDRTLRSWSAPRIRRRLARVMPWQWAGCLPRKQYPVLDAVSQVPGWVWHRPDLVVERFVPERDGTDYVLRCWIFFGAQEYSVKLFSSQPVVKATNFSRYEYLHEVPANLREARRALNVDYGKFDYVVVDGRAVLLDVNKTPTVGGRRTENLTRLATGLAAFAQGVPS